MRFGQGNRGSARNKLERTSPCALGTHQNEAAALTTVERCFDLLRHAVPHLCHEHEYLPQRQPAQRPVGKEASAAHGRAAHYAPSARAQVRKSVSEAPACGSHTASRVQRCEPVPPADVRGHKHMQREDERQRGHAAAATPPSPSTPCQHCPTRHADPGGARCTHLFLFTTSHTIMPRAPRKVRASSTNLHLPSQNRWASERASAQADGTQAASRQRLECTRGSSPRKWSRRRARLRRSSRGMGWPRRVQQPP